MQNSKQKTNVALVIAGISALLSFGCQATGYKLQKAKLLDATMDPAKTSPASASLASLPQGLWEKAPSSSSSSSVQSSCPTCGS